MFKDKETEEREKPKIEIEEKTLEGQDAIDYIAKTIEDRSAKLIRAYFTNEDMQRDVASYEVKIDNVWGDIIIEYIKDGTLEHTESFKV